MLIFRAASASGVLLKPTTFAFLDASVGVVIISASTPAVPSFVAIDPLVICLCVLNGGVEFVCAGLFGGVGVGVRGGGGVNGGSWSSSRGRLFVG